VGAATFDRQRYPGLSDLPMAATEAQRVAAYYAKRLVLVNDRAQKKRVEAELAKADVIHFATHYLSLGQPLAGSRLLLTSSSGPDASPSADELSLQEVQLKRLPKAKLVVLAACRSGIDQSFAGEGLIGLSRAFLMAGVPLVVASHWEIESESTAQLMIDFHRLRRTRNLTSAQALRQAQLDMMTHEDERYHRPYYWAAFFPIGGYASF